MAVLGLIAEFNPFHNGHLHLINEIKSQNNFTAIICVMSGNFTQRGEPAICHKWSRAEMALENGVDLVIELPFVFASRSAYYFARAAVQLLSRTGLVTHLAFGSETDDIEVLQEIALFLNDEPEDYKKLLDDLLARGLSYPVARSRALQKFFDNPSMADILSGSNDILGIEYLRNIDLLDRWIIPFTIKRKGSHFHSKNLTTYASATAIREALYQNRPLKELDFALPQSAKHILMREIRQGRAPIKAEFFGNAILAKLRTMEAKEIEKLYDVNEGLETRIIEKSITSSNLNELRLAIKSKRYSYTRISRILLYSLFNLNKDLVDELDALGPLYHHVLGFTDKGINLLGQMKESSELPILNRGRDVKKLYDETDTAASKMIKLDIMASNLYNLFYPSEKERNGASDFTTSPIRYSRL